MKNNRYLSIGAIILSVIAIIVVIGSLINTPSAAIPPTSTLVNTLVPSTPTITSTPDPCSKDNLSATINRFDRFSREFSDAFLLAQNTPAAQLAPQITELQRIRRNAEDYEIPGCLTKLKEYQISFMNVAINATIVLYSNFSGDPSKTLTQDQINEAINLVNQNMNQASQLSVQYTAEMGRLLGVTLTPSPAPASTEAASTPTPPSP